MTASTTTGYAGIGRKPGTRRPPIPNRIRERRKELGMSQLGLAKLAHVSPPKLAAYENERDGCHVWTALKLAKVLRCHVEDIFTLPEGW